MRRPVLQQAVVVRVLDAAVAPPALRVVAGLFREDRRLLGLEVDGALGVSVAVGFVKDVHGMRVGRVARAVGTRGM